MHPKDDDALNTDEKIWDLTQEINVKGGKFPFLERHRPRSCLIAEIAAY